MWAPIIPFAALDGQSPTCLHYFKVQNGYCSALQSRGHDKARKCQVQELYPCPAGCRTAEEHRSHILKLGTMHDP